MAPEARRVDLGPTGDTVADNIRRIRVSLGMNLRDLAESLRANGHPIAHSGLSKIENKTRRVDVDDLMALAVALGVTPLALLLPASRSPHDLIEVSGWGSERAGDAWGYALGITELVDDLPHDAPDLMSRSFPLWAEEQIRRWASAKGRERAGDEPPRGRVRGFQIADISEEPFEDGHGER